VDGRNATDINRRPVIYRGSPEARHEAGPIDGRAELVQAEAAARGREASTEVDLVSNTVTRAASSSSAGLPRTTLTSGSVSIARAYDGPGGYPVTRVPHSADRFAVPGHHRVFSS
jgi:hypothetical protein